MNAKPVPLPEPTPDADVLRLSEARYRRLFETAQDGILILDAGNGQVVDANPFMQVLLGYSLEEFLGKKLWEIGPFKGIEASKTAFAELQVIDSVRYESLSLERKDGRRVETEFISNAYVAEQRRLIQCNIRDITERKRSEESLRLSEARYRRLFQTAQDGILILDAATGQVVDANPFMQALLGYSPEEFVGKKLWGIGPFKSIEASKTIFAELQIKDSVRYESLSLERKDGRRVEAEFISNAYVAEQRQLIQCNIRDITERRQAEGALRRFRALVDQSNDTLEIIDPDTGRFLDVNERGCAALGCTREEYLALRVPDIDPTISRAEWPQFRDKIRLAGSLSAEGRHRRKDGTTFPVEFNSKWVRLDRDYIVTVVRDITERKNFEEQSLRAQRLESVGMLAAGITHDLNNVLAPISMATTLLRKHLSESGDLRLLDILEKCAERGAGLVRQILGFVHGIGGEPRLVQVQHLLRDITAVVAETFPKSIVLQEEVSNELWPILANPTQIHQVLLNLCVNARDAMPQGGTLLIRAENLVLEAEAARAIEGGAPGAWLMLQIGDTGTGIPPAIIARIWEPFYTTKPADKGTGLGLSTVRGIVETCRGFITVQSEMGRGSSFRVYLPAAPSLETGGGGLRAIATGRGHGELILLADDEEHIRDTAKAILANAGYEVITAVDGFDAVAIFEARAREIALVITDFDMPNVDGAMLGQVIHALKPALKILAMSGTADRGENLQPFEFATAFMPKPFTAAVLLEHVQQLLHGGSNPAVSAAAKP